MHFFQKYFIQRYNFYDEDTGRTDDDGVNEKGWNIYKTIQYNLSEYINRNTYAGTGKNHQETSNDIIHRQARVCFW